MLRLKLTQPNSVGVVAGTQLCNIKGEYSEQELYKQCVKCEYYLRFTEPLLLIIFGHVKQFS